MERPNYIVEDCNTCLLQGQCKYVVQKNIERNVIERAMEKADIFVVYSAGCRLWQRRDLDGTVH